MSKGVPLRLELRRRWKKADYIIGELSADGALLCNTLELPEGGNAPRVSCILPGENRQKGAVLNSAKYEDEIIRRMREASGTTIKIY